MSDTAERITTWKGECPLRQWRAESGESQSTAAVLLGVATGTIRYWEAGAGQPNPDGVRNLDLVRPGLGVAMVAWFERRPSVGT